MCDSLEMPCPCQVCGSWFDLHDGCCSEKWHPNTVICASCGRDEENEIEIDDEIVDLKNALSDAEVSKADAEARLIEILKAEPWRNEANEINFAEVLFKKPQAGVKKVFYRLTDEGAINELIIDLENLVEHLKCDQSTSDIGEQRYTIVPVLMTQEEYEDLPEYDY